MQKELLTIKQASNYLKLTKDNIYRMTSKKTIPHFKPSKNLLFDKNELDAWLELHAQETTFSNFKK